MNPVVGQAFGTLWVGLGRDATSRKARDLAHRRPIAPRTLERACGSAATSWAAAGARLLRFALIAGLAASASLLGACTLPIYRAAYEPDGAGRIEHGASWASNPLDRSDLPGAGVRNRSGGTALP